MNYIYLQVWEGTNRIQDCDYIYHMSALQPQKWHLHSKVTSGSLDWMKSILHQLIIQYLKILCSILYYNPSMPLKINIGLFWMSISIRMKSSIIPSRSWWCLSNFNYKEEISSKCWLFWFIRFHCCSLS